MFEEFFLGAYYTVFILASHLFLVIDSIFNDDLDCIQRKASLVIQFANTILYTFHLVLIYSLKSEAYVNESKNYITMFFHWAAGPCSFILDFIWMIMYQCYGPGGILIYFKMYTVRMIRQYILGSIKVFPLLMAPFFAIITIIYIIKN